MKKLTFHCGDWSQIDPKTQASLRVISQVWQTGKHMSDIGKQLLADAEHIEQVVFSNIDVVFNGLRVAIRQKFQDMDRGERSHILDEVVFMFHRPGGAVEVPISKYGTICWPPDGFFDQMDEHLTDLLS
jgi:hypothetical protein